MSLGARRLRSAGRGPGASICFKRGAVGAAEAAAVPCPVLGGQLAGGGAELFGNGGVIAGRDDDSDARVILGGGADHGGAADIDIFDEVIHGGAGVGGSGGEAVEVDDHHIDGSDGMLGERQGVIGVGADGEDAAVNLGVEGL